MHLKIEMVLLPPEVQPKHSWRYMRDGGGHGVETIYIKKAQMPTPPPKKIVVHVKSEDEL